MARPPKKYEKGVGKTRLVVELDEEQFRVISKDLEKIEGHLKDELGTTSQKAAIIAAIKHYARHIERGDFEK
ncbi:hypothetical protein [Methanocella sp. MCL-LM]|uniref:hypothetical protein n=1 Tax=Methanocella sp. MCL-LM TaxID=3412035 RepID=UPI003C76B1EC